MVDSQKQQVMELLQSLNNGDMAAISHFASHGYCEHNSQMIPGGNIFIPLLHITQQNPIRVDVVRIFRDKEYVFTHCKYDFPGQKVGFDIFRFENGKIVEHWDNLQTPPTKINPSKHSMTDGPTAATHLEDTEKNKALVKSFISNILIQRQFEKTQLYLDANRYIQHNPYTADGINPFKEAFLTDPPIEYHKLHMIMGEGDFVLTVSEGNLFLERSAFYDLFRVENGKIVEHWDVIERIPERKLWKNDNGKF